jgi:hypothetical protein
MGTIIRTNNPAIILKALILLGKSYSENADNGCCNYQASDFKLPANSNHVMPDSTDL